ncbi:MAG: endonuclease/exonuclease/phosphatase family protein [Anaerolineales bacterium]|nr:endonuclease/exonuclease/phosphatase family protein [Anaerolineales bacterium]
MSEMQPAHKPRRWRAAAWGALGLVGLATLAGFGGRWFWLFEVAGFYRPQLAGGLLLAAVLPALRKRPLPAVLCLLFALINALVLLPLYRSVPPAPPDTPALRLLVVNVQEKEDAAVALRRRIAALAPDVVVALEVDYAWAAAMRPLLASHPYAWVEPRYAGRGIALFSRVPLDGVQVWDVVGADRPALLAEVTVAGQRLTLVGLHPHPAVNPRDFRLRNAELARLAAFLAAQPHPVVVAGDLNLAPWGPVLADFLAAAGLENGRIGHGLLPTWPTRFPLLRVPLDHVLVSPDLAVRAMHTPPADGADHLPLLAEIALPAR